MQEEGLRARVRKRFNSTTISDHDQPIAGNVLDRQFAAERPNQRWVGDTTEFVIGSSAKLYLAAIMDLHSRFIVGWAVSAVNDRHSRSAHSTRRSSDAVRTPASCITPTRAARTPAKTIDAARGARHHLSA